MRVIERGGDLIVEDSPGLHWLLGLLFLVVGAIFFLMPLGLARDAARLRGWERAMSLALGGFGVAAGLWVLAGSPLSRVYVERLRGRVRIVRLGVRGRWAGQWPIAGVESLRVVEKTDDEGGATFQVHLVLRDGGSVEASMLWAHGREHVAGVAGRLAEALGVELRGPS